MEVKEAADLLDNLIGMIEDSGGRDYDTALKMGIEALTSKPTDCISRQVAINALHMHLMYRMGTDSNKKRLDDWINSLPSAQETHEERTETHGVCLDTISRRAAIDAFKKELTVGESKGNYVTLCSAVTYEGAKQILESLPSAQPERTCVNCGRTANNGGWYADGSTRCPIEEHYALPKDGFCHLWEQRNVTDDDYPERMEE